VEQRTNSRAAPTPRRTTQARAAQPDSCRASTSRDPMPPTDPLEILTADEVAALLHLDRKTVYAAAARGEIPHRRLGRRLVFERGAIVEWLRQPRVTSTAKEKWR